MWPFKRKLRKSVSEFKERDRRLLLQLRETIAHGWQEHELTSIACPECHRSMNLEFSASLGFGFDTAQREEPGFSVVLLCDNLDEHDGRQPVIIFDDVDELPSWWKKYVRPEKLIAMEKILEDFKQ